MSSVRGLRTSSETSGYRASGGAPPGHAVGGRAGSFTTGGSGSYGQRRPGSSVDDIMAGVNTPGRMTALNKLLTQTRSYIDPSSAKYAVEKRDREARPGGSQEDVGSKGRYPSNVVVPYQDAEEMQPIWEVGRRMSANGSDANMRRPSDGWKETPKSQAGHGARSNRGGSSERDADVDVDGLPLIKGHTSMLSEKEKEELVKKQRELLDPTTKLMRFWDLLMALLLFYTGIVTPFEVSFVETKFGPLFVFNRFVDLCFLGDMGMNFVLPYQNDKGHWVHGRWKIAARYMRGWFPLDAVSIFPFDMLGLITGSESASNLKVLRVVRLLRLAKLLRILRVGRVFRRWESSMAIDYMKVELFKFIGIVLAIAHWLACAWHMVIVLEDNTSPPPGSPDGPLNWVDNYAFLTNESTNFSRYLASLYWSVATLSTLGYGDVVPSTDGERFFVVICTIIGSSIYAYMIGNVCGLISGMDAQNAHFYETMRSLNLFMQEKKLPRWLQVRLRDFFRFRRNHSNVSDYADLLTAMSPALRAHVSGFIHRKWVRDVRAFKGFSGDAVAAIAMHLESQAFSACESIFKAGEVSDMMYIVERGVVLVDQRVVVRGGTFGEDMMYRSHSMRRTHHAVTLTHVVLLSMHHEMLNSVIGAFPIERKKLRKAVVRVVFRDCVLSYVRAIKKMARNDFAFKEDWEAGFDERVLPLVYTHKYRAITQDQDKLKGYIVAVTMLQRAGGESLDTEFSLGFWPLSPI